MALVVAKILPNIFLGTANAAANTELLAKYDITRLISCDNSVLSHSRIVSRRACLAEVAKHNKKETCSTGSLKGIHRSPIATNLWDVLPSCFSFIEEQDSFFKVPKTLIYSQAGFKQSVIIVLAYMIIAKAWPLANAANWVQQALYPTTCNPAPEYLYQLQILEKTFFNRKSTSIRRLCRLFESEARRPTPLTVRSSSNVSVPMRTDMLAARLMKSSNSDPTQLLPSEYSLPATHHRSPLMAPKPCPRQVHLPLLGEKGTPDSHTEGKSEPHA